MKTMPNLVFDSAQLWLSPARGWAIEKYSVAVGPRGGKKSLIEGQVEYDRMEDGVAMPKRVVEQLGPGSTIECVFTNLEHRASNMEEFTLSFYGLPESLGQQAAAEGIRWYRWFALAGIALLIIAYLLRKRNRRHER